MMVMENWVLKTELTYLVFAVSCRQCRASGNVARTFAERVCLIQKKREDAP